jgi:hypothetical protein
MDMPAQCSLDCQYPCQYSVWNGNGHDIFEFFCMASTIRRGYCYSTNIGGKTYIADVYNVHAASALAANSVLRSLFGVAFP